MSLLALIREDMKVNPRLPRSMFILAFFRIAQATIPEGRIAPAGLGAPIQLLYVFVVEWLLGLELLPHTKVGRRLRLSHVYGTVVHSHTVIGDDVVLRHGITLGALSEDGPAPTIGNGVDIGTGATILGGVTVGDHARIGAHALVLTDVPSGTTAVGVPARILPARAER